MKPQITDTSADKIDRGRPRKHSKRFAIWLSAVLNKLFRTGRKEGNVLFNDALNTFYLRLYGVRHMVKGHSGSEK